MVRQAVPYFRELVEYDPDAIAKQWKDRAAARETLAATRDALVSQFDWVAEPLEVALRGLAEARGVSTGKIFQPLRVALTGVTASPGIFDVLVILGRDRSLRRLDAAVTWLS